MKDKLITIIHMLIFVLAATSFLWLDIRLLLIGLTLYWLQIIIFDSCVLSIVQFKNKDTVFMGIYINKLLRKLNMKELTIKQQKIFMRYIEPIIILILAVIYQVILKFNTLI